MSYSTTSVEVGRPERSPGRHDDRCTGAEGLLGEDPAVLPLEDLGKGKKGRRFLLSYGVECEEVANDENIFYSG